MPNGWLEWFCTPNSPPLLLPRNFCSSQVGQFISPWMCCKHSHHRENLLLLMFPHPTVSLHFFQLRPSSEIPSMATCLWELSLSASPEVSFPPLGSYNSCKAIPFGISPLSPRMLVICICVSHLFIYTGDGVPGRRRSIHVWCPWEMSPHSGLSVLNEARVGNWRQIIWLISSRLVFKWQCL